MSSLISDAHATCYDAFADLISAVENPVRECNDQVPLSGVEEEFDKYKMWAGNVGAAHSGKRYEISLDYRLRQASFFKDQVLTLLATLNKKIEYLSSLVRGECDPFEERVAASDGDTSRLSASEADQEKEGSDESPWEISSSSSGVSGASPKLSPLEDAVKVPEITASPSLLADPISKLGRVPTQEMPYLLDSIKFIINCLYRVPLRKPAPLDRLKYLTSFDTSCYQPYDLLYVRDKFPSLNREVAIRLGKMITRRRRMLLYRETHNKNLDTSRVQSKPSEDAKSQATSSAFSLHTKATTARPEELDPMAFYATSVSDAKTSIASNFAASELCVKVPPKPKGNNDKELDQFECPYCFITRRITTDQKWKKHVFEDLQPYVCTYADCALYDHFFKSRDEWYKHETQQHRAKWFCNTISHPEFDRQEDFLRHMRSGHSATFDEAHLNRIQDMFRKPYRGTEGICNMCKRRSENLKSHVARHLEQIALFALPRVDETAGSGTAESDGRSSGHAVKGKGNEDGNDDGSLVSATSSEDATPEFAITGPDGEHEEFDPNFFVVGRVFALLWPEPLGSTAQDVNSRDVSVIRFGEKIHVDIRRFVLIEQRNGYCYACTYGGRATKKDGVDPITHGLICIGPAPPQLLHGESKLGFYPIRVEPSNPRERMPVTSRVDYSIKHAVQHNVKAKNIGMVYYEDIPVLGPNCDACTFD